MSNTELLSGEAGTAASAADQPEADKPKSRKGSAAKGEVPQQADNGAAPRRRGGLSSMVMAELRQLAGELGITSTTGMRKGDLIAAIKERQGGGSAKTDTAAQLPFGSEDQGKTEQTSGDAPAQSAPSRRARGGGASESASSGEGEEDGGRRGRRRRTSSRAASATDGGGESRERVGGEDRGGERQSERSGDRQERGERQERGDRQDRASRNDRQNDGRDDDDEDGGGRRRGRRFRDRRRGRGRAEGGGNEPEVREDDVLLPVAGILDVLENYAFVRTSGYLAGPNDVYVSLSLVRKYGLRRGDAITGVVRQPREGEQQRQKFNPMVRVDSINGLAPDAARGRPEFTKMTPLYPNERLRLETESHALTGRVIDLVMPVGKGQRALIVSPPKAGKTMVLQAIANAITTNNPECYLMVVLVDERPEEVTDMQRSVKGEVIASTFDRPPSDHTTVSELAIERAKRLVELGYDVVVLLDSITRLGRAYNLAAPASGRILSGGVDSTALYPPKRFLGAARNIENGGSLTIFATALVETGSAGDTVIFEEFKGTGNAELKLDRKIADKRTFPAVDVDASSTRKEELLLSPDELAVTHKLRRVLSALDDQQALDLLLERLRKTRTNIEFLMQVAKNTPGGNGD
ncbi:transcription termination factor Rho [Actinoalloteichus spitiensis]|uniref:transcription termination factor Rho n=1 Tax=Actinoalloteichus spitiensis TaxID=252394 RepID=UPI00047470C4|nr:transcription termination factor Rho [Actinoalloteichus spitiensis]